MEREPVTPLDPPAAWLGGKSRLAARIIAVIEALPHACYAEPFLGMGGVFLRRPRRPKVEVINDLNGDIVTFFRVIKHHPDEFRRQAEWLLSSRREFDDLRAQPVSALTDIQRAVRFIYLQRLAFGGQVGGVFGVSINGPSRLRYDDLMAMAGALHQRLKLVVIENLSWADFLPRYDAADVLFYLDPPYMGGEGDYGKGLFAPADFARMAEMLAAIQGGFVLSLNDCAAARRIFAAFAMAELEMTYTVARAAAPAKVRELLISNRDLAGLAAPGDLFGP